MTGPAVTIVGAGPVGLTLALALAQQGVAVDVLETLEEPSQQWRASTFHPPTLHIAERLGIVDEMLRQGLVARTYQLRDRRADVVATFDFGLLADETRYPFRLQLEQYKYVQILLDSLARQDPVVPVRFGREVTGLALSEDLVELSLADGVRVCNPWVVAADGASSTVRQGLGLRLEGSTYEHRYLVLSILADLERRLPGICDVNYISDPDEHLLVLRTPDVWRVILAVPPEIPEQDALSDDYVGERLHFLSASLEISSVVARQIYRVHQRVVERFRQGRVILVGDAAHINSPMGGMGLNSGIHDAYDLGVQLAAVIREGASTEILDSWAARRRAAAIEDVQRITHQTTQALGEKEANKRQDYLDQMVAIASDPGRSHDWMLEATMVTSARKFDLPVEVAPGPGHDGPSVDRPRRGSVRPPRRANGRSAR